MKSDGCGYSVIEILSRTTRNLPLCGATTSTTIRDKNQSVRVARKPSADRIFEDLDDLSRRFRNGKRCSVDFF